VRSWLLCLVGLSAGRKPEMASFRSALVLLCAIGASRAQYNITCNAVAGSLYDFSLPDINQTTINFKSYAGHVLMIANVASF